MEGDAFIPAEKMTLRDHIACLALDASCDPGEPAIRAVFKAYYFAELMLKARKHTVIQIKEHVLGKHHPGAQA